MARVAPGRARSVQRASSSSAIRVESELPAAGRFRVTTSTPSAGVSTAGVTATFALYVLINGAMVMGLAP
eukprot:gene8527-biopygen7194